MRHTPWPGGTRRPGTLLARYEAELGRLVDRGLAELAFARGRELERLDLLMRNIVQQSFDGVVAFAEDGRVGTANPAAEAMFGLGPGGLAGRRFEQLFPDFRRFRPAGDRAGGADGRWHGRAVRPDGGTFPVELALRTIALDGESRLVAVVRNTTHAEEQQARLRHQATHDALTGLANRVLLHERLEEAVRATLRDGRPTGLLLLDLDRFKEVNDTLGHHVGDRLLQEFARRLCRCVRPGDPVARLGGDESAVLLPDGADLATASGVAARIAATVREPFALSEEAVVEVGVSVGIALAPGHGDEGAKLLQSADVAMYAAKAGGTGVEVYERARDRSSLRHLALTGALRRAIEGGGLDLRFQPKLCLSTGRLLGAEALARWTCPELGVVAPDEFVPHAEKSGLIHDLLAWTLDAALAQAAELAARGVSFAVAVNTSCLSLQDRSLHDVVAAALARHRVDPGLLTLELTERAMLRDPEGAAEILGRLHEAGVRLSVDDFGTGYSSLALLQKLAVDEIKIDRSFVARMTRSRSDLVLVRSTVELAHNLGLLAVAEGVEEEEQARLLRQLACDAAQGFLFAPALAGAEVAAWATSQATAAEAA